MSKKTIRDINVTGKKVFVRVDFNVPLDAKGQVSDDTRIVAAIPTIMYLIEHGAKVILASHLGRPDGQKDKKYSLKSVAQSLAKELNKPVQFLNDCIGDDVEKSVDNLTNGGVILLENLRFYNEETDNDKDFSKKLAKLADVYVNDAFGTAHRAHASTEGITKFVKTCVSGFLIERELDFLGRKVSHPEHPFTVILGGAKVSDKIKVIDNLLDKADSMLIGGAMAYTFLLAQGKKVGNSLVEKDKVDIALKALAKAKKLGVKLLLPVDTVASDKFDFGTLTLGAIKTFENGIEDGWEGVDIGPKTVKLFSDEIAKSKTILWNGPMGVFEIKDASKGTFAIATAIAKSGATSIIGGGDSITAIKKSGEADKISFMSTGGGASLEFLEGKELPGIAALSDK